MDVDGGGFGLVDAGFGGEDDGADFGAVDVLEGLSGGVGAEGDDILVGGGDGHVFLADALLVFGVVDAAGVGEVLKVKAVAGDVHADRFDAWIHSGFSGSVSLKI